MTGAFSVQTSEMLAVADLAADAATDLSSELDKLKQKWEDLAGTWKGLGAKGYAPEFEQWVEGAQKVVSSLDSSSILLTQHAYSFEQNDSGSGGAISSAIPG